MCLFLTMLLRWEYIILIVFITPTRAFWDMATTTQGYENTDTNPRQSFFRWQRPEFDRLRFWFSYWDWTDLERRRALNCMAGLSIDFLPLGIGALLNRRCILTSANFLEPYQNRQTDIRIWALGRAGTHITPYRYRVWRTRRVIPKSNNPEHYHGPRGLHVPRHDVSVVHSKDQIYIYATYPTRYHYAYRTVLAGPRQVLDARELTFAGSGYEYLRHIRENYKIFYGVLKTDDIVNCEKYLPKWWGKFICFKNVKNVAGVPNGGPLSLRYSVVGLGCFEIRYNEDRIMVFTDLRYYWVPINHMANHTPQEYYEYAYPQWGVALGSFYDGHHNYPYIPYWQRKHDIWPLGK